MNMNSPVVSNRDAYQKLRAEAKAKLESLDDVIDIACLDEKTLKNLRDYRNQLASELEVATKFFDHANQNATVAKNRCAPMKSEKNVKTFLASVFDNYGLNLNKNDGPKKHTELGGQLIAVAREIASETFQQVTGFRPSVPSK